MRALENQPPLLPLVPSCLRFLSRVPRALLPPPLSLYGADKHLGATAQRPRRGLSTSRPQHGGSSGPRHDGATAPTPITGGPARQAQHEWLLSGSGSLSQSSGCCPLATSRSRRRWPTTRPLPTSTVSPLPLVNSIYRRVSILPSSKQTLCCAESACCKFMFQVFRMF
jgi:hypothetical protein